MSSWGDQRRRYLGKTLIAVVATVSLALAACAGEGEDDTSDDTSALSQDGKDGKPSESDAASESEAGSDSNADGGMICVPGSYVFCRCADRSEGAKLCKDDGESFEPCDCSY